jgi:hypothetical protein
MTPSEFLHLLWGEKPGGLHILIWTLQGKVSNWFQDIDGAVTFVQRMYGTDVYVGVGLSAADKGPHQRCCADEVAGIGGLWADFDLQSPAHQKKPLPATIDDALKLIPAECPPTIIISTGNGLHAWWLFQEPWIFVSDEDRNAASVLSTRFQTLLQYNSNQQGWAFDRLSDLSRVLRIPGTVNAKDPAERKTVEVYEVRERRYSPAEISDFLDRLAIPGPETQDKAIREMAVRFDDSPLIINLQAGIPADMLSNWLERDKRFRSTWNRDRKDMSDQSSSGYDMALVCFGVTAGVTDQQIVDLIIQHRRIHGDKQNRRLDYYQRTISKARRMDGPMPRSGSVSPPSGSASGESSDGLTAPAEGICDATAKAILCDQLSSLWGVRILRIVKVPGTEPIYRMELEAGRIEFDIGRLMNMKSFGLAVAARTGHLIPHFRPIRWRELTQMMLNACTVIEGTDDLEFEGAARIQIEKYLADNPCIPSLKETTGQDRHRPIVWRGQIVVHSTDVQAYINRTTMQNQSVRQAAAILTGLGALAVRVRSLSFQEQNRWALPTAKFPPPEEVPDSLEEADGE